jgi:transcriptional regulator with XRE-family HTH domain
MLSRKKDGSVTQKISDTADRFSNELTRVPRIASRIDSAAEPALKSDAYWREYFSYPAFDFAESLVRIRRKLGLSQAQLATKLRSQQPAIARLETGEGNPRLSTLVEVARGLECVVRVEVLSYEQLAIELRRQPWFVGIDASDATSTHEIHSTLASESNAVFGAAQLSPHQSFTISTESVSMQQNNNFALAG